MNCFDRMQQQVKEAEDGATKAAKDLCAAIVKSNGQIACALKKKPELTPAKR